MYNERKSIYIKTHVVIIEINNICKSDDRLRLFIEKSSLDYVKG